MTVCCTVCSKILIFFFITLSLLVSIYRVYDLYLVYLSYSTKVSTIYVRPYYYHLPSITFCGPKAQFITDQYYEQKFGHPVERPINSEECDQLNGDLNNGTTNQFESLFSANDLKKIIQIQHNRSPFDIKVSINKELFCFTLYQEANNETNSDHLMSIGLKLNLSEIMVLIQPSNEGLLEISEDNYEVIKLQNITDLRLESTQIHRLPSPYTNCHGSYGRSNSPTDYIGECRRNTMYRILGCLPSQYFISDDSTKFCDKDISLEYLKSITKRCNKYKPECFEEHYSVTQHKRLSASNYDYHKINIFSSYLNKQIYYTPVMTFVEFVERVGNILTFWLTLFIVYLIIGVRIENTQTKNDF